MKTEDESVNTLPLKPEGIHLENPAMLMHPTIFAYHIGHSVGVVGSWIDNGYLPTVKIGKHRLINLPKLKEQLMADSVEFSACNEAVS